MIKEVRAKQATSRKEISSRDESTGKTMKWKDCLEKTGRHEQTVANTNKTLVC